MPVGSRVVLLFGKRVDYVPFPKGSVGTVEGFTVDGKVLVRFDIDKHLVVREEELELVQEVRSD